MVDLVPEQDAGRQPVDVLEQLALYVVSDHTLQEALQFVADLALAAVWRADGVGISLKCEGDVTTAVATSQGAVVIDDLQYAVSAGPCLEAMKGGQMYVVGSMLTESRWPDFTNKALYAGC
ncbi:MAG: hypothetical protein M3198_15435, partial [Actinomycetota bacterium]|nr:hypothetical protein [Actinomycetota bacterium]